jgi:predicted unusual protein kinase regulating ubiquinone biosynthesis (AarF/ABC1/UbiB family)
MQDVARVFFEDTGRHPEEVFEQIDTMPIAAASLAQVCPNMNHLWWLTGMPAFQLDGSTCLSILQVHKAVTKDGQTVAVKLQYPHLRHQVRSDLAAMRMFVSIIEALFPEYGYSWLLPDFEDSLKNEINFLQEAHNGERVARMFANNPRVHIPTIRRDLSSERVLVMEFINGVKVRKPKRTF